MFTYYVFIFLFGISLGSFMNVLIYRIPNNINLAYPPSTCPCCGNRLKWYHNIPIVSYLFLRGSCGFCSAHISSIYPIVEFLVGLLSIFIYYHVEMMFFPFLIEFSFFYLLLTLSIIDYKIHMVDMRLIFFTLFVSFFIHNELFSYISAFDIHYFLLKVGYGVVFVSVFFLFIFFYSKFRNIDLVGEGDYPIIFIIGFMFTQDSFFVLFLSALFGFTFAVIRRNKEIPFVPFLSLAIFVQHFFSLKNFLV